MPLTDYEQSVIDDLERSLTREDPKLAQAFRAPGSPSYKRIIGIAVGILLGIAMLTLGFLVHQYLLTAAGFAVIFAAVAWAGNGRKPQVSQAAEVQYNNLAYRPKELATSNSSAANGRFMDRLEDRWNRRQSELG
jgi:hypothetical protein